MTVGVPLLKSRFYESVILAKLKDNEFHSNFHYINHQGHKECKIFIKSFVPVVN